MKQRNIISCPGPVVTTHYLERSIIITHVHSYDKSLYYILWGLYVYIAVAYGFFKSFMKAINYCNFIFYL